MDLKEKLKLIKNWIESGKEMDAEVKVAFSDALSEVIVTLTAYELTIDNNYKNNESKRRNKK